MTTGEIKRFQSMFQQYCQEYKELGICTDTNEGCPGCLIHKAYKKIFEHAGEAISQLCDELYEIIDEYTAWSVEDPKTGNLLRVHNPDFSYEIRVRNAQDYSSVELDLPLKGSKELWETIRAELVNCGVTIEKATPRRILCLDSPTDHIEIRLESMRS